MKIFLSHASEDKPFVRELAAALSEHHTVWFDEYVLTLGDSLLKEIDKGLRACDYGVVVLSKAFFSKKWPRTELDALFTLETAERKVILPIWKDLSEEDVKAHSVVLATRLAIPASEGVPRIVAEIDRAVNVAARVASFSDLDSLSTRLKNIASAIDTQRRSNQLLMSTAGVTAVHAAICSSLETLHTQITKLREASQLPFSYQRNVIEYHLARCVISAPFNLFVHLEYKSATNIASDATLRYILATELRDNWGKSEGAEKIEEHTFTPHFDAQSSVCWKSDKQTLTTSQLAPYVLDGLVTEIERKKNQNG